MSSSEGEIMRHQIAALAHWKNGNHRESANEYWKAFRAFSSPTHQARFHVFHGCTSILREEYFSATDEDFDNMNKVLNDKHEPRLFRVEAGFTLGLLHYSRGERTKCSDAYYESLRISEKPPTSKQEKMDNKKVQFNTEIKAMKELMKTIVADVQNNYNQLNASTKSADGIGPELISDGTIKMPAHIGHGMPIGRGGTKLTKDQLNNLIDVGGTQCDCCKRKDLKLEKCTRCNMAYYCSKECQRMQWKVNGHKQFCRQEGQFELGDLVQIARLKNKPDLNGIIVRVAGSDPKKEGRYAVRMEGATEGDPTFSVAGTNVNRLRPYDCIK
ncbi:hypothetical protein ACHAWF_004068 [Thalassiosira exigua]